MLYDSQELLKRKKTVRVNICVGYHGKKLLVSRFESNGLKNFSYAPHINRPCVGGVKCFKNFSTSVDLVRIH
eukprot:XP_001705118.1 Hypothetical protein GL50803_34651 [Giardia lamblia ATCC 50803]